MDGGAVNADADQTRSMVKARLLRQDGSDSNDRLEYWNEVVIDEHLLLQQLRRDPALVIPAFVYDRHNPAGINYARRMRDDYAREWSVTREIPLIAIDAQVDVSTGAGPFVFEGHLVAP